MEPFLFMSLLLSAGAILLVVALIGGWRRFEREKRIDTARLLMFVASAAAIFSLLAALS